MCLRDVRFRDETWMETAQGRNKWRALVLLMKKILICCHSVSLLSLLDNLRLF
jgi:hypothetical protein